MLIRISTLYHCILPQTTLSWHSCKLTSCSSWMREINLIPSLNISLMIVHIIYELYTLYYTLCDRGGRFNTTLRNLLFAFSRQLYRKNRGGKFLRLSLSTFRYEVLSTVTTRIRLTNVLLARLPLPGTSCFSIPVFILYFQRTSTTLIVELKFFFQFIHKIINLSL